MNELPVLEKPEDLLRLKREQLDFYKAISEFWEAGANRGWKPSQRAQAIIFARQAKPIRYERNMRMVELRQVAPQVLLTIGRLTAQGEGLSSISRTVCLSRSTVFTYQQHLRLI